MVHRPADSRLLLNLLQQEKDYLKQFNQLFSSSAASIDSFTAYAAASPPPASQVILAVAGLLAAADDALKRYALGVEQWRDAMRLLKDMEDDVGNIMRDREILVTRLIKVSKSHKSNSGSFRDSLLIASPNHQSFPSSSSLSLSAGNHDSPSPSRPVSASFPTSTKLAAAQSELQACETHLASKEAELGLKRCVAAREGLTARAKAMIDCSWAWGQLGKQILRSLDDLGIVGAHRNEEQAPSMPRDERNPAAVGDCTRLSSDFSSISPSQSASQINWDGQQLPEPINMMTVVTNMDSGTLGQPTNDNKAVPDPQRLSVSTGPTLARPHSAASTAVSSLYYTPATPTTYKLETVTYAPAVAVVVPGKSPPPPPVLGAVSPLALGPSLDANSSSPPLAPAPIPYAPVTEELSEDQGLHTKMRIPPAHAINEYDIPTSEAVGSGTETGTSTVWRHSRGESQEGSTWMGHSNTQTQRTSLVASASEPVSSNAMFSNMTSSTLTVHPQRHVLERRITEEELRGNSSTVELSRGGGGGGGQTVIRGAVTSALIEVFDDPLDDNEEDDELPVGVEDQLIKQGKLAVVENPRFMSAERKKELEKEQEREQMKVAGVEEGREQESEPEPVKEKKKFPFLHKGATHSQGQSQSQSDLGHVPFPPPIITSSAAPSTPKTSPSKAGGNLPNSSPSKTSPSKRIFGSLRGLFGARQPASPQVPSQVQNSSPPPSKFSTRKQDPSPSRFHAARIRTADDSDEEDSDVDSPTKAGGGLQALFRGAGAKKTPGSAGGGKGWSTRTDKNIRKLARTGDDDNELDGYLSQDVGGNGYGIAGNAVMKAGLVDPGGGGGARLGGTRKRSASDIGIGVSSPAVVVDESTNSKVVTGGGKRLKKVPPPPPSAAASASALYNSPPQRNETSGVAVHPHTPTRRSSLNKTTAPGKRSASVDDGARRINGVQQGGEVGQQTAVGGDGKGTVVDLGKRRRRIASDMGGPPLSGAGPVINTPFGAPARGIPGAGTSVTSKGYSSDTAAVSGSAASPLMKKKSVVRNAGPGPAAASIPAAAAPPTAATVTPSRPTPTTKTLTQTPNIPANPTKAGGSRQPYVQPQPHQHPTSHFTSSSGGAIVLAAGGTHPSGTLVSHPGWDAQALPTPGGGLSRNNSILSAVSAPTGSSGSGMSKKQKQTMLGHGMGGSGTGVGRRSSLGSSSGHGGERKTSGGSSTGPIGSVVQPTQPAPSLMSIVEDVAKHNREWVQESSELFKNRKKLVSGLEKEKSGLVGMVDVVKAPPRVARDELEQLVPVTIKGRVLETSTMNVVPGAVTGASGGSSGARLVNIKAPGSVFDQRNVGSAPTMPQRIQPQASNSTPELIKSQQTYHSELTRRASVTATSTPSSSKRPAKSPLRSALKNPSRTPSPLPGPFLVPHLQKQQQYQQQAMAAPIPVAPPLFSTILGPAIPQQPPSTADIRPTMGNGRVSSYDSASQRRKRKDRNKIADSEEVVGESGDGGDSTSGNEIFYTDDEGHQSETEVVSSLKLNGHAVGYISPGQATGVVVGSSELSHSTTSTAVAQHVPPATSSTSQLTTPPPRRRKSVRVSLQPTFSPSPPAIEYDDEEEQKYHAPWVWKQEQQYITEDGGGGSGQYVHAPVPIAPPSLLLKSGQRQNVVTGPPEQQSGRVHDIWEDSSDEDVEYQKAKRLLTRAARKEKDMNAFAAGSRSRS